MPGANRLLPDGGPWFGCFTGDCPHGTQAECDAAIRTEFARLESEHEERADTETRYKKILTVLSEQRADLDRMLRTSTLYDWEVTAVRGAVDAIDEFRLMLL